MEKRDAASDDEHEEVEVEEGAEEGEFSDSGDEESEQEEEAAAADGEAEEGDEAEDKVCGWCGRQLGALHRHAACPHSACGTAGPHICCALTGLACRRRVMVRRARRSRRPPPSPSS